MYSRMRGAGLCRGGGAQKKPFRDARAHAFAQPMQTLSGHNDIAYTAAETYIRLQGTRSVRWIAVESLKERRALPVTEAPCAASPQRSSCLVR